RTALNIEATTIHDELHNVFGDDAPSYRTVARWVQWFRDGREVVEEEERSGRPVTESTPENIQEVQNIVTDDPHLQLRKATARYVPKHLTESQRNERQQRPRSGPHAIKLHHDNGGPHVHEAVLDYLRSEGVAIIPQPPNSPDISPCDFWLFDLIKRNLADQSDAESLHHATTEFMYSLDKEEYKKTFEKWIQRMQLCVDNEGHYFEHFMK
ncbi:unnamed protein product, partial [Adineta ricciae]